jgi:hypothetical protein
MGVGRAALIGIMLLLATAPPAEAAKRRVPHGFFGVTYDRGVTRAPEHTQEAQAALMARSGVESVRSVFSWARADPRPTSRRTSPRPTPRWLGRLAMG